MSKCCDACEAMEASNICVVCEQPKDNKGRCFSCFRKYSWIVSTSKGIGASSTIYGPPPETPEDAPTCDVCERFTQFFHFIPELLKMAPDDFVIPHVCSTTCLALAILKTKESK